MFRYSVMLFVLALFAFPSGHAIQAAGPQASSNAGQQLIDRGQLNKAYRYYSELIEEDPSNIEGYRGRIETLVLMRQYAHALADYARIVANVLPLQPDAIAQVLADYQNRLAQKPQDVPALSGGSFVHWCSFDYDTASALIDQLLIVRPKSPYGVLLRGSIRTLSGNDTAGGINDLEAALALDKWNPHVRFVVADAYTYGVPNASRAFWEASVAILLGLDTPRLRAILAASLFEFGFPELAAKELLRHINTVTQDTVTVSPLAEGDTYTLDLVPGRTFEIPIQATAGTTLSLVTDSPSGEVSDTIMVLLNSNGIAVTGNDDANGFYAAFEYQVPVSSTYKLLVTSFEAIGTGQITISRD